MTDFPDDIDLKIIALLKQDSRLSHKQIGEKVHRTGQAVGSRIHRLIEQGIIENYTVQLKYPSQQFIRLLLNDRHFSEIEELVNQFKEVDACYKTAGDACYIVIAHFQPQQLAQFIEAISMYCHYSISTTIRQII